MKRFVAIFLVFSVMTTLLCVSGFCVQEASAASCSDHQSDANSDHILGCETSEFIAPSAFNDNLIVTTDNELVTYISYNSTSIINEQKALNLVEGVYPPPEIAESVKSFNNIKILTTGRIRI